MSEPALGELPEGWCWSEAASLVDGIAAGKSFKCDERPPVDGEVGIVKVSAVTWGSYDEHQSKTCTRAALVNPQLFVRPGDFLFSRANTIELVGACVIADRVTRDVMLSDKILRLSVRRGWDRWLLWSLRSSHGRAEIERLATGNQDSMRNIGQSRLLSIRVPLPASGERQRIVQAIESYFTRLDVAVATLERVERNLKRYRASVLKSAVEGRLVPTEAALAKQEGRDYEPASVLLERILAERRRCWAESGKRGKYEEPAAPDTTNLPDLPEGWCWASIGRVVQCLDRLRVPINKRERLMRAGPIPYYGANGAVGWIDRPIFDQPLVLVVEDETFIGREKPFSYKIVGPAWVNNHAHVLSPTGAVDIDYLNYSLMFYPFTSRTTGTTGRRKLTQDALLSAPYALPPLREQCRIAAEVALRLDASDEVARTAARSRLRSPRLRQSILKWAFEGKLADQDPNDEPASALLDRIKAERETAASAKTPRPHRATTQKTDRA